MTDDVGAGFTAIFTIIIVMACGILMVPLIFGGIDWIAHYDRYEQYKMYRQQVIDELRSATDETGWYTEQFDIYSHYADPRENYTFEDTLPTLTVIRHRQIPGISRVILASTASRSFLV